jgi:hypothetical protein|nr:MAG TPA: hypothetical protein [Caudoviricetes sp.]
MGSIIKNFSSNYMTKLATIFMLDKQVNKFLYYNNILDEDILSQPDVKNPISALNENKVFVDRKIDKIIKEGDITLFINVKSDAPYSDGARVSSLYNVLTIEIGVICHKSCRKTINGIRELVVTDRIRQILTKTPELQGIGDLTIKSCSPMYSIPYYDYNGYSTQFEIIYWKDAYNNEIS